MTATVTDIRPTAAAGVAVLPADDLVRLMKTHLQVADAYAHRREPDDLHIDLIAADQRLLAYSGDITDPGDVYTLTSQEAITAGRQWALRLERPAAAALVALLDAEDCAMEDLMVLSAASINWDSSELRVDGEYGSHVATLGHRVTPAGDLPDLDVHLSAAEIDLAPADLRLMEALTERAWLTEEPVIQPEAEAMTIAGLHDRPQPDEGILISRPGALVAVPYL